MQAPIPIESRALGTLAFIRTSIESSGSMAVPGMTGITMGVIGILATLITSIPSAASYWLQIWLVAAVIALAVGGVMMAREAAQSGHAHYLGPVRKFLLCLCPALGAGMVMTGVLWHAGHTTLIPGVWLLLYGCALLSASTVTVQRTMKLICIMGSLFMLLGLLAFVAIPGTHTLILGMGFGVLHTVFGILIGRVSYGD